MSFLSEQKSQIEVVAMVRRETTCLKFCTSCRGSSKVVEMTIRMEQ